MKIRNLHNWTISVKKAIELQKSLAEQVQIRPFNKNLETICGVDCAFSNDKKNIIACAVVLSAENFEIIEISHTVQTVNFPYIPGLLSFREAPACLAAAEKLTVIPDCFVVDGQGIAHPRRLGLACHLGLFFDIPTIGCAKSRLIGNFKEPGPAKGSTSRLVDIRRGATQFDFGRCHNSFSSRIKVPCLNGIASQREGETIGSVVRSRSNVKPLFVSAGHKCRLSDAVRIVLDCCRKYRLPEPSRLAHQTVTELKSEI